MSDNPRSVVGGNQPPEPIDPFETVKQRVDALVATANDWLEQVPEIADETAAAACDSFLSQVKAAADKADATRREINKPHDDEIKANNERFRPLTAALEQIKKLLTPKKTAWLKREEERIAAERRKAEEEARRAVEEAERAAAEAEKATTVEQAVAAEEKIAAAETAVKLSDRLARLKPTVRGDQSKRASGLRSYWSARITDWPKAIEHYSTDERVRTMVQALADADARKHKDALNVPGVEPIEDKRAA